MEKRLVFCFLCLIVRLAETQVSMTNAKGGEPKIVLEPLFSIPNKVIACELL